jgi:hypothetical protein
MQALGSDKPASLSGYVRNAVGIPQMGATVEVLGASALRLRALTDENGFFELSSLIPGTYTVKVTAASFLPTLREHVSLRQGASTVLNLTLNTLFDSLQLGPPRTDADPDDWKWTMRSVASRPVLRILPDGSTVVVEPEEGNGDEELRASLSVVAGSPSDGYGSQSDMMTGFALEQHVFGNDEWTLAGNVGYGGPEPAAVLRGAFTHHGANGSDPTVALTVRSLAPPESSLHTGGLQAVELTTSDSMVFGNVLELHFGSALETVQFMGRVTAFRPFGTADVHLSPNTVVEYAYASTRPTSRSYDEDDPVATHLGDSGPRVSLASFSPALERANHQEVSVSHRVGATSMQMAFFADHVSNTVLTGLGEVSGASGELLPDLASGTFSYRGPNLDTNGLRLVLQRKLRSDLTATLDYGYGGALTLSGNSALRDARSSITASQHHAVSARLSGRVPRCKTHWSTSYGWTNGHVLTSVDMFNGSPGQSDPYLNIYVRQPLPSLGFLPVKVEAMVDLRNLLAQGYVPLVGPDGQTVYLVQSARSIRGGLAFTF